MLTGAGAAAEKDFNQLIWEENKVLSFSLIV